MDKLTVWSYRTKAERDAAIAEVKVGLTAAVREFKVNPSAVNYGELQKAMLAYQHIVKNACVVS